MKKFLLLIGLLFGLAFIGPAIAQANCQWFQEVTSYIYGEKVCGGDTGWQKSPNNMCLPQLKMTGYTDCCCGPTGAATGCCFCGNYDGSSGQERYVGVFTTAIHCAVKRGSGGGSNPVACEFRPGLLPAAFLFSAAEKEKACAPDQLHCRWYPTADCSTLGLVVAKDPAWCRDSEKPNFASAQCCCGKAVNQTTPPPPPPQVGGTLGLDWGNMTNPLGELNPSVIVGRVIRAILAIIGSIFLIMIIYGGFIWMTAAGNDTKVAKGRNILIWAIAGIIVIFLAWMLVALIFEALAV